MDDPESHHKFVVLEVVRASTVTESVALTDCVVLVRNDYLEVVEVDVDKEDVTVKATIQFEDKISAACRLKNTEKVIVICNLAVSLVYYVGKWIVEEILSTNPKGQQQAVDSKTLIASEDSYFLSHQYQGTLQVFFKSKEVFSKKRKLGWSLISVNIGLIVVTKIALNNNILALLYRDFNFNYSMRYYRIDSINRKVVLKKQFDEFDESPSQLIAMKSGFLLVSSLNLQFFSDSIEKSISVSSVVDVGESFPAFEVIDDSRVILISHSGMAYIVNIVQGVKTIDIKIFKMNFTTIPINVHHISESYFFASSRTSQSVLFRVIPKEPYITLVHSVESSPPVLDLLYVNSLNPCLLSCQGGYHSGELKKYQSRVASLKLIDTFSVGACTKLFNVNNKALAASSRLSLHLISKGEQLFIDSNGQIIDFKVIDGSQYFISNSGITVNNSQIYEANIEFGIISESGLFVFLDKKELLVFNQNGEIRRLKLNIEDVTGILMHKDFVLITNWHGSYCLYHLNPGLELIVTSGLPQKISILSADMIIAGGLLFLILLTESGITQVAIELKSSIILKTHQSKLSILPLQVVCSEKFVILFNDSEIFGMSYETILRALISFQIDKTNQKISDVICKASELSVLLVNGKIKVMEITVPRLHEFIQTLYSRSLDYKILNLSTNLAMVISKELSIEGSTPSLKSTLRLINVETMAELHTHNTSGNLTDMCLLNSDQDKPLFVVLSNGTEYPLITFTIKKSKIVLIKESGIKGLDVHQIDLESISKYGERYFISGSSNFIVDLEFQNSLPVWTIDQSTTTSLPIHTIGHTITNKIYIADLRHGLNELTENQNGEKSFTANTVETDYSHQFISSVTSMGDNVLVGDLLGNVSVIDSKTHTQHSAFNIGDLVNVIKPIKVDTNEICTPIAVVGTVSGGIYLIHSIGEDDYKSLEKSLNELKKTSRVKTKSHSWKLITKDSNGEFIRYPQKDALDLRFLQNFMKSSQKSSKLSVKNRMFLQQVYYDCLMFK